MAKAGLYAIRNATIVFAVSGNSVSIDPLTGNAVAGTENLSYEVYLDEDTLETKTLPGANYSVLEYGGNLVNPKIADSRLREGIAGTLTKDGRQKKCVVKQIGAPFGTTGLIGKTLCNSIGTPIIIQVQQ